MNIDVAMDRETLVEIPNTSKLHISLEARQKCTMAESKLVLHLHQYKNDGSLVGR